MVYKAETGTGMHNVELFPSELRCSTSPFKFSLLDNLGFWDSTSKKSNDITSVQKCWSFVIGISPIVVTDCPLAFQTIGYSLYSWVFIPSSHKYKSRHTMILGNKSKTYLIPNLLPTWIYLAPLTYENLTTTIPDCSNFQNLLSSLFNSLSPHTSFPSLAQFLLNCNQN